MPRFELEIPHSLEVSEARTRLGRATAKLENQYGAKCTWQGEDTLLVSRKGLSATVNVEATRLSVALELGLLLTPLSGAIRSGITKELSQLLT
jgi:putative polyhydroxyalkanoate system protein